MKATGIRGGCRGADAQGDHPDLGVSAMGNQLVLSGTPAQLQEAERTPGTK